MLFRSGIGSFTAEQVATMNKNRFGRMICGECSKKIKAKQEAEAKEKEKEVQIDNSLADALNAEAAE